MGFCLAGGDALMWLGLEKACNGHGLDRSRSRVDERLGEYSCRMKRNILDTHIQDLSDEMFEDFSWLHFW